MQRRHRLTPVYGALPSANQEGLEAARRLRAEANRKRRRARLLGRVILLVVVALIAIVGYFAYQAIKEELDEDNVSTVDDVLDAGDPSTSEVGASAVEPDDSSAEALDVQQSRLDTADDVSGVETLEPTEEALGAVDEPDSAGADPADAPVVRVASLAPGALPSRLEVLVRRFDSVRSTVQHLAVDVANDAYASITAEAGEVVAVAETTASAQYRFDIVAGTLTTATRGEEAARPQADPLFITPITPATIFPPEAVLHSTATDVVVGDVDGEEPAVTRGYIIDLDGFMSTQPEAAEEWVALVTGADPDSIAWALPGASVRTASTGDVGRALAAIAELSVPTEVNLSAAPTPGPNQAIVAWSLADNGFVSALYVHIADGVHWLYQVDEFDPPPFVSLFVPS